MESEKKTVRRIGSFTFGIMLILIGLNILLETITTLDLFRFTLSLWPIVFILLGIETLYFTNKKNVELKYDFLGILTIFVILFLGIIFSTINYGINKVLYSKNAKSDIMYYLTDDNYNLSFSDKVKIINASQSNVKVTFIEDKEASDVNVRVKFDYNNSYEGSMLKVLKDRDLLNTSFYIDYNNGEISVNSLPDFIKDVQIIVTASDKSKLEYNGEIN